MTLEELSDVLREYYQDYEWYVLSQLRLDDDEDGDHYCGATVIPAESSRMKAIIIPGGWELDLEKENVSDGVKLLASRIVATSRGKGFSQEKLRHLPWFEKLVQHYAYGSMKWSDRPVRPSQTSTTQSEAAIDGSTIERDSQIPSNQSSIEVLCAASENRLSNSACGRWRRIAGHSKCLVLLLN